ncbi:hypothetical protein K1T71_008879 [Dendrolimus kikuchii]|uniref:Uncharacterized protein n=1 Tax=Dendrolimus kikuchii TaxID=765133 RepID=A0ACC1CVY2_9NEOP|nr:hypothetical protein K1T71_008879 [Dendrolimus kikuchii]
MRLPVIAVLCISFICGVAATVTSDDEPFLKIMARSTVYEVGETKAIFCKGKNLPEKIEWYSPSGNKVEERSIKNNRFYVERRVEDESNVAPLIIHNIKLTDGGNWTCKAGDFSESIEFIVGEKAILPIRNETRIGEEKRSVKLLCEAKGHPTPSVFWHKDGAREAISSENKEKYVIKQDHTLEIKNLNHNDVGTYVCKVRQKLLSHYTDKTIYLSVRHKPVLYNNSTNKYYTSKYKTEEIYAIVNETKNITCSAVADPLPTFRWYRRLESFDEELITEEDTVVNSEDGMHSTLILRMYDKDALGEYKCTANNSKGQESIIFHVSLGVKPDPPDFVSLVSANVSSLTFNVTCATCPMEMDENMYVDPENLTITGYTFQLVPVQEGYPPDWDQSKTFDEDIVDPFDTLFTIGPLPNNTEFHGRVCARNAAGSSDWLAIPGNPKTSSGASESLTAFITLVALLTALSCWL